LIDTDVDIVLFLRCRIAAVGDLDRFWKKNFRSQLTKCSCFVRITGSPTAQEAAMDNRVNELRRKISSLRAEMMVVEAAIRDQVNRDRDCAEASLRLMAKRAELLVLVGEWKAAGGGDRLPTVEERLKQNHRLPEKWQKPARSTTARP
jgi:chorismate mutase